MAWTIPDAGGGQNDLQSVLFREYLEVLVAGIDGLDCVLSGGLVTASGAPDMNLPVAKAAVLTNGVLKAVAAGTAVVQAADATNPRLDLVVITSAGAIAVREGTAAAAPKPAARTANDVVLAAVYVPANDTTISADQLTDMRLTRSRGPICIYKTTVAEVTNTTAAAIQALNKANSGVTIPSGLFLSGRILRVRLGGNMLLNSGTPTVTVAVAYGGTTMYSDVSGAAIADADRRAWWLDFDLVAQANADQSINGHMQMQDPAAAQTAPATGIGDVWGISAVGEGPTAFSGAAAVDSDAADRLLSVQVTFSVSNAANELVVETATVEII